MWLRFVVFILFWSFIIEAEWISVSESGNKPNPRFWHSTVCFVPSCFVYGGRDIIGGFEDFFKVEVVQNIAQWEKLNIEGVSPGIRNLHSMVAVGSESLALFGGLKEKQNGNSDPVNDLLIYFVANNTWVNTSSPSVSIPSPRAGVGIASMQNQLFIYGGYVADSLPFFDELWSLDLTNFNWNLLPTTGSAPPPSVSSNLLASPSRNRLIVFGGTGTSPNELNAFTTFVPTASNSVFLLDLNTLIWNQVLPSKEFIPPLYLGQSITPLHFSENSEKIGGGKFDIDFKEIQVEGEIGRGAFGTVFKGRWRQVEVAIKYLPVQDEKSEAFLDFKKEAEVMMSLRPHPNVVLLLGIIVKPHCIITEYLKNGSLLTYLRNPQNELTTAMTTKIIKGISAGMMHLTSEGIVHRDLAARNVLLSVDFQPKISDFGLSRLLQEELNGVGKTSSVMGPLKHMAPECILSQIYSQKTDVWAFGVVVYEVVTREEPYLGMTPVEASSKVSLGGLRLVLPKKFHGEFSHLVSLMEKCFLTSPDSRPTFSQICDILQ